MTKVDRLNARIEALEKEVSELRDDRNLFREHFINRFQWWVKLQSEKSSPNLAWIIQNDAKWLQRFKYWVW